MPGQVNVNGNGGWIIPDYSIRPNTLPHSTVMNEITPGPGDRHYETSMAGADDIPPSHSLENGLRFDEVQSHMHPRQMPEPSRMLLAQRDPTPSSAARAAPSPYAEVKASPLTDKKLEKHGNPAGGLGIQFGEHQIRRPSLQAENQPSPKTARNGPATITEPKSEQQPPVPVPLLSPVREVRTPSPTARRKEEVAYRAQSRPPFKGGVLDLHIPSFAELLRTKQERERTSPGQKPNGISEPRLNEKTQNHNVPSGIQTTFPIRSTDAPEESPKGTVHHPQVNGWQQQSGKKSSRGKSGAGSGQFTGEPLPANEADRKGG